MYQPVATKLKHTRSLITQKKDYANGIENKIAVGLLYLVDATHKCCASFTNTNI